VPAEVGALAPLRVLDLRANLLTSLPASLAELRGLEKLDLRWNKFADLPAPAQRLRRGGCVVLI
jgi:Leucine-rich repeat (LRR) protein